MKLKDLIETKKKGHPQTDDLRQFIKDHPGIVYGLRFDKVTSKVRDDHEVIVNDDDENLNVKINIPWEEFPETGDDLASVRLKGDSITGFPFKLHDVQEFEIEGTSISSLKNVTFPTKSKWIHIKNANKLSDLKGIGQYANVVYDITTDNPGLSFAGLPSRVNNQFQIHSCVHESLKGCTITSASDVWIGPYTHAWDAEENNKAKFNSFEGFPAHVDDRITLMGCNFRTYKDMHKHIKHVKILSIFDERPAAILGLLKVQGLMEVEINGDDPEVGEIITKHLNDGRDIIECQNDLIDAGFEEWAKL